MSVESNHAPIQRYDPKHYSEWNKSLIEEPFHSTCLAYRELAMDEEPSQGLAARGSFRSWSCPLIHQSLIGGKRRASPSSVHWLRLLA